MTLARSIASPSRAFNVSGTDQVSSARRASSRPRAARQAHSSGDSRSGRHLFGYLQAAGAQILAAGASDWVVFPGPDGYPADEAYFLHFIIHTIHGALAGHPELDPYCLDAWAARRHAQIERCELVYIAHQMDFVGRWTNDDRR